MLKITITANSSPLTGLEGDKLSETTIKERLLKEAENDVALKVTVNAKKGGGIEL